MAMGEWISVQTSREAAERQLEVEADELDTFLEEEREELRLIYLAKGLTEEEATTLADNLMSTGRPRWTSRRARSSGSTRPTSAAPRWSPRRRRSCCSPSARSSRYCPTCSPQAPPQPCSRCSPAGLGLFALVAATTVITGRSALRSGLRQLLIGWAAAAVTYGIGALIEVSVVG